MATATQTLKKAASYLGYSNGTYFGKKFVKYFHVGSYYGQSGVPWCAMFVSDVLYEVGQTCPGFPSASCGAALSAARRAGVVLSNKKNAKPGDIVIFDWDGKASNGVDHVGFVEINKGSYIQTIEGNTGNAVRRRTRNWSTVAAIIRPKYSASQKPEALDVDGIIGPKTVTRWQQVMKTYVDGVITGQFKPNAKWYPAITAVEFDGGTGDSALVKAVQIACGLRGSDVDGIIGRKTAAAVCAHYGITGVDKINADVARAIQKSLNNGKF